MSGPVAATTADGSRLHLQHGPIDLIVEAFGDKEDVAEAYRRVWARFQHVLDELVEELPTLRRPVGAANGGPSGRVARRMAAAVRPFSDRFITPMAAVAGAVADEICAEMTGCDLRRAYVNNGGDIAMFLMPGETFDVGLVPVPRRPSLLGKATVKARDPVRGVATSGRHGRSFSMGIADAVTVLAADAALADAAATLVANAVDLPGHPAVHRAPADELDPDSDLRERLVTVEVGTLTPPAARQALASGMAEAERMRSDGLIVAAVLCLDDQVATVGLPGGDDSAAAVTPVLASAADRRSERTHLRKE
jgi:ApbE superfamily uncharacterized protein (UPF0280 family)